MKENTNCLEGFYVKFTSLGICVCVSIRLFLQMKSYVDSVYVKPNQSGAFLIEMNVVKSEVGLAPCPLTAPFPFITVFKNFQ